MKALIVYHTKTGHTAQAARDIARGLEEGGVGCVVASAHDFMDKKVELEVGEYDIVIVGTPTYGNRRYRLPAKPIEKFLESLPDGALEEKLCGAFAVNAGIGASKLVKSMEAVLAEKGGKVIPGGPAVKAGAPLSLWKGPDASAADVEKCMEYGRRIAGSA